MTAIKSKRTTHLRAVMAALLAGEVISRKTVFEGVQDGEVSELKSRIYELRKAGWPILKINLKNERYCKYILVGAGVREAGGDDER